MIEVWPVDSEEAARNRIAWHEQKHSDAKITAVKREVITFTSEWKDVP